MLDDDFNKQRAKLLHGLAVNADPFIKRRLLDLAKRYEGPKTPQRLPLPSISADEHPDHNSASEKSIQALPLLERDYALGIETGHVGTSSRISWPFWRTKRLTAAPVNSPALCQTETNPRARTIASRERNSSKAGSGLVGALCRPAAV